MLEITRIRNIMANKSLMDLNNPIETFELLELETERKPHDRWGKVIGNIREGTYRIIDSDPEEFYEVKYCIEVDDKVIYKGASPYELLKLMGKEKVDGKWKRLGENRKVFAKIIRLLITNTQWAKTAYKIPMLLNGKYPNMVYHSKPRYIDAEARKVLLTMILNLMKYHDCVGAFCAYTKILVPKPGSVLLNLLWSMRGRKLNVTINSSIQEASNKLLSTDLNDIDKGKIKMIDDIYDDIYDKVAHFKCGRKYTTEKYDIKTGKLIQRRVVNRLEGLNIGDRIEELYSILEDHSKEPEVDWSRGGDDSNDWDSTDGSYSLP